MLGLTITLPSLLLQLVPALLEHGLWELPKYCHFMPSVPIKPMLAKATNGMAAQYSSRAKSCTNASVPVLPSAQAFQTCMQPLADRCATCRCQ
jgi:hypothetical protein